MEDYLQQFANHLQSHRPTDLQGLAGRLPSKSAVQPCSVRPESERLICPLGQKFLAAAKLSRAAGGQARNATQVKRLHGGQVDWHKFQASLARPFPNDRCLADPGAPKGRELVPPRKAHQGAVSKVHQLRQHIVPSQANRASAMSLTNHNLAAF